MPLSSSAWASRCSSPSRTPSPRRSASRPSQLPRGTPQMNLNFTMVVQAIVFALFIWFTVKLAWPMFLSKVDARTKTIADGLAEAERGRNSLAEAQKATEKMVAEARARAQEIVAAAEKSAAQRVEESKAQAKTEGERLVAAAQAQIQQEVQSA